MATRKEWVYLVVMVLKTKNNYRLVKKKPENLAVNEFCYAFEVTLEEEDWFNRIGAYKLPKVVPPEMRDVNEAIQLIGPSVGAQVINRFRGRPNQLTEDKIVWDDA